MAGLQEVQEQRTGYARGSKRRRAKKGGATGFQLVRRTLARAWSDRVLGLAAEAGFWQLLSLPPLVLAVLGTIGYASGPLGQETLNGIEGTIVRLAAEVLTPSAIDGVVRPVVQEVLTSGRADVVSLGFVMSLWSGSSAMATFVNTITIAYGQRDERSAVRSRLVALGLYVMAVLSGIVLLPLLVVGPQLLSTLVDDSSLANDLVTLAYWPVVVLVSLAGLASLYHFALPLRRPWRRALPGALAAMVLWLVGSFGLRVYIDAFFGSTLSYGSLSSPIAVLLFLYVFALAVLLGAELNAELERLWPLSPRRR